jgi:transposase
VSAKEQSFMVMIGIDPAKHSHAMAVLDGAERQLAALQVANDSDGYRAMLRLARRWPQRTWAVEGASGVGTHLAQRLVADGETVLDVPPKLSTRARMLDTGHGRKNDPADARTIAVVGLRTTGLRRVEPDGERVALKLMSERRRELVHTRTQTLNRLHQLLTQLIPAGAPKDLSATKAKALLATVRPRDVAGRTRRQLAVDLIDDVVVLDRKVKDLDKRLAEAVAATGTSLTRIVGIGPVTAALILGETGDVRRFASKHHYATYTGTAPREVSSGDVQRHRLSRAGNRRLNHALHMAALANKRFDDRGRDYYARKVAAGKGSKGALRCLKRRLSDAVFRALHEDLQTVEVAVQVAGPVGHSGASTKSSAAARSPMDSTSDQSLAGPAKPDATPQRTLATSPS